MRGRDEDTGEFLAPSRSQQRREALDVLALGQQLAALSAAQLAKLPIPEDLLPHIEDTQRITSHIAHKRQLAFLAKQMRRVDDETLAAIRDALDAGGEAARRETAELHRVEAWRERLIERRRRRAGGTAGRTSVRRPAALAPTGAQRGRRKGEEQAAA